MRPPTVTSAAFAALLALVGPNNNHPCTCNAFVAPAQLPVRNRDGTTATTTGRSNRPTRRYRRLVQRHASPSSSHGRYDHLHANARPSVNPNNRLHTQTEAQTATAQAVADQFIEEYLQSLPGLRRHSGDAVIQRSIEAVRRAIAAYWVEAGNIDNLSGNAGGNIGAANALPEGRNAASLAYGQDADPSPAQQQPTQQLPSTAAAASFAPPAAHQAEAALTDYLDGLSSGQFVSTPGSAEAVGAIRSYLDSLAEVENDMASATTASNAGNANNAGNGSFGPPYSEDATTINIASTTNIQNANALADMSGEEGVIARSVHEEDGGDTTTETTVTREGEDTVLTITSTTRIVLPKE